MSVLPKVTIMIPTYNQEKYIRECILSALDQDYPNLEILISNDCSTDGTRSIIDEVARYAWLESTHIVRVVHHGTNVGRVANYQWSLNNAHGALALNLDGDDYLTNSSFISECVKAYQDTPRCVMVMGQAYSHYDGTSFDTATLMNPSCYAPSGMLDGNAFLYSFPPFKGFGPIHMATLYDRKRALEVGGYRLNVISSDFDLLYRIGLSRCASPVKDDPEDLDYSQSEPSRYVRFIPLVAGVWRQHKDNTSRNVTVDACISDLQMFARVAWEFEQTHYSSTWAFDQWRREAAFHAVMPYLVLLGRSGSAWRFLKVWARMAEIEPGIWTAALWAFWPRAWRYVRKHFLYTTQAVRVARVVRRMFPNWGRATVRESVKSATPQLEAFVLAVMWLGVAATCFSLQMLCMKAGYYGAASTLSFGSMIAAMNVPLSMMGASIGQMARRIAQGMRDFRTHIERLRER